MAFIDLYRELCGTYPDLPVDQAKRFINRAQRDVYDAWNWSFLAGEGALNVPASVSTGTLSVTQGSQVVTGDAAAAAAWNALGLFIPITSRALKIGTNQPYQILAYDSVDTVYLDRPYTGIDNAAITYILYRPYYASPTDFQRWVSIVDTVDSWNLILGRKRQWLDIIDPQRNTIGGPAQFVSFFMMQRAQTIPPFGANTDPVRTESQNLFELWPAPTVAMSLTTYYKKRGADLVADTDESVFEDGLLIARGLYYATRFVQTNAARYAKTTGVRVNWAEMKKDYVSDYYFGLQNSIKRDDNITGASILQPSGGFLPSSSWLTRHLTFSELGRLYGSSYYF